ncbi:hypothetical protein D3C80_714890 [compost metagenome]
MLRAFAIEIFECCLVDVRAADRAGRNFEANSISPSRQRHLDAFLDPGIPASCGGAGAGDRPWNEGNGAFALAINSHDKRTIRRGSVGITECDKVGACCRRVYVESDRIARIGAEIDIGTAIRAGTIIARCIETGGIDLAGERRVAVACSGIVDGDLRFVFRLNGERRDDNRTGDRDIHLRLRYVTRSIGDIGDRRVIARRKRRTVDRIIAVSIRIDRDTRHATIEAHLHLDDIVVDTGKVEVDGVGTGAAQGSLRAGEEQRDFVRISRCIACRGHIAGNLDGIEIRTGRGTRRNGEREGIGSRLQRHRNRLERPVVEAFRRAGGVGSGGDEG